VQTRDIRFFEGGLRLLRVGGLVRNSLAELVQLAGESVNSSSASLYAADWQTNVLIPAVTYGLPAAYVEACGQVTVGDQCCGRAVLHRKPWFVSDMLSDPLFASAKEAALVSPIRAGFSVPVIADNDKCIGSLACHYHEPRTPTPADIERNEIWATMIAHAISSSPGE
jgi:GAF domain-containing protein